MRSTTKAHARTYPRFDREAKLLASLNHPNIAAIYGLEERGDSPDRNWLVYESLESGDVAMTCLRPYSVLAPRWSISTNRAVHPAWSLESDREGDSQIYITTLGPGGRVQSVTTTGGTQVRWSPRGDELFYISLDGDFTSIPVRLPTGDDGFPEPGTAVALFPAPIGSLNFRGQQYDVSPDGQRFLMSVPSGNNTAITLLQGWSLDGE